ncbi:hypothetical protein RSOLAG1IB_04328 [Rhizoctonia solani AG-1 IB]|uniref:Granulin domain-containing protein n=1 Tax=Thanatephorus cucumeris (strain AG1-IB / isolate 7/3/14) TaxID=1108050 RepID=A0A0B7FXZ6_THACB|nr:hypothetical protein RSOLAG1IB_04328 [Rhizoctonia solani AG-1 IB]
MMSFETTLFWHILTVVLCLFTERTAALPRDMKTNAELGFSRPNALMKQNTGCDVICDSQICCPVGYTCLLLVTGVYGCCPIGEICMPFPTGQCADPYYSVCPTMTFCCPSRASCTATGCVTSVL